VARVLSRAFRPCLQPLLKRLQLFRSIAFSGHWRLMKVEQPAPAGGGAEAD
jgi:hypothetical protein